MLSILGLIVGLTLLVQTATPTDVAGEVSALVITGLGLVGSAIEQFVKKAITPFDTAPPTVKMVVTFFWGIGLAWLTGKVPWLAHTLPSDPGLLGTFANGIVLTALMMGLHSIKKNVQATP